MQDLNPTEVQANTTQELTRALIRQVQSIESPIERAMEIIGDKYSVQIIDILTQFEPKRFVELEDQITGISPRTLSARLKHLERFGLISRLQFATIPPRVEYRLTDQGRALSSTLKELKVWANQYFPHTPVQ